MFAIKSVENINITTNDVISLQDGDKVSLSPNTKVILIDYETGETKIVYRYNTFRETLFKTCEIYSSDSKYDFDMSDVIGYCTIRNIILKPCSKKLYELLSYIERVDTLWNRGGIHIAAGAISFYDGNNIFGTMVGIGDFDIADLLTSAALVDSERLNKMIDEGIIYLLIGDSTIKIVLDKNKNISNFITKLVVMNSSNNIVKTIILYAQRRMHKSLKSINFGITYGMVNTNLVNKLFGNEVQK